MDSYYSVLGAIIHTNSKSVGIKKKTALTIEALGKDGKQQLRWEKLPCDNSPPARYNHAACVVKGSKYNKPDELYIFGGRRGKIALGDLWKFDSQDHWTEIGGYGIPPEPRFHHSMVAYNKTLIIFGGCGTKKGSSYDLISGFNTGKQRMCLSKVVEKQTWINETGRSNARPMKCIKHTATVWESYMVVFGGKRSRKNNEGFSHLWALDLGEAFVSVLTRKNEVLELKQSKVFGTQFFLL